MTKLVIHLPTIIDDGLAMVLVRLILYHLTPSEEQKSLPSWRTVDSILYFGPVVPEDHTVQSYVCASI